MEKWGKKEENAGVVYKVHGRYGLKNVKWESDNRVVSENQEKLKIYENEWNRLKPKRKTDLVLYKFFIVIYNVIFTLNMDKRCILVNTRLRL